MTGRPDWSRVKEIFEEARELAADERQRYLEESCGRDDALREEVESLLRAHDSADGFLSDPPTGGLEELLDDPGPSMLGRKLGRYRVQERIASGGTGTVYLAVRDDAEFQRRVALKVIRRGMATEDVLRRFRSERQILASIDHPHIARLLDGGSTAEGLPYLVMEYIEGEAIDEYCDSRRLDVDARLKLFRTVCDAVQVAHRNLVVHRDLKPGNILVTGDGEPKLLDFGIAKLLDPESSPDGPHVTVRELRMLTPEYASPEQIRGDPVTTASDVYSLGVLLYELLAGCRPQRLRDLTLAEMERAVTADDPHVPSAAVAAMESGRAAEVAARRDSLPERLERRLRGDLDVILMKALRKEPARRYPSVEALDEDVRRHLEGLPVAARPDTFWYRATKFTRRHRLPVAVAATAAVLAIAFVSVLGVQSARLARERDRAAAAAEQATRINRFMQEMLASADPVEGRGRDVTVMQTLEASVPRIGRAFQGQPALEAAARQTIGETFLRLGRYAEAEELLARALELRRSALPAGAPQIADSLAGLARLRQQTGDYASAGALYDQALEIRRRQLGDDHPAVATTLDSMATLEQELGNLDAAEELYRRSLEMRRRLLGDDHEDIATSLDNLGTLLHTRLELDAAESLYRDALAMRRRVLEARHPDVAESLNNVASLLHDRGRLDEAESLYRESLELTRESLGERHPDVAVSLNNLAALLHDEEEYERAESLYRRSLEIVREALGPDHPGTASSLNNLAALLHDQGDLEQAESLYRQSLEIARQAVGPDHHDVGNTANNLAALLHDRERYEEAEPLYREAARIMAASVGEDHPDHLASLANLAILLEDMGRHDRAVETWRRHLQVLLDAGTDDVEVAWARLDLGIALVETERFEEAEAELLAARGRAEDHRGTDPELYRQITEALAFLYDRQGRPDDAARYRTSASEDGPEGG